MKRAILATIVVAAAAIAADASAQALYDWPDEEVPAVVHGDSGILFIGKDKTVFRAYTWRGSSGKHTRAAWFVDLDRDGKPNIVGAGKPTFGLQTNSDPWWFEAGGCDQVIVKDMTLDDKMDIFCLDGKSLEVYTHDWQRAWEVSLGQRYDYCQAADVNGDLKADIECKIRNREKYARFDVSAGSVLAQSADESEVADPSYEGVEPIGKSSLEGEKEHDLDGDGTAEETVVADGNAFVVKSRSRKKAMARIETKSEPIAVLVKDLDGDKKPDIVGVTESEVIVSDANGENVKKFSTNAKSYDRKPVADLESVYANGFADDAAAQKKVEDANEKLSGCYSSQVRRNQFAGVGTVLMEVQVGADGKVTNVQKHHSSLADEKVVSCAKGVLKKLSFDKPGEGKASINITMKYTFRDE